jgi:hypothetical protein
LIKNIDACLSFSRGNEAVSMASLVILEHNIDGKAQLCTMLLLHQRSDKIASSSYLCIFVAFNKTPNESLLLLTIAHQTALRGLLSSCSSLVLVSPVLVTVIIFIYGSLTNTLALS